MIRLAWAYAGYLAFFLNMAGCIGGTSGVGIGGADPTTNTGVPSGGTTEGTVSSVGSTVDPNDLKSLAGCWSVSTNYTSGQAPKGIIKKSPNLKGPVPTTKWWGSALWDYPGTNPNKPFSMMMFALPLTVQTSAQGLGLSYVATPSGQGTSGYSYNAPSTSDLVAGSPNMLALQSNVDAASDWSVSFVWPTTPLRATIVKGSPYAFFETDATGAQITIANGAAHVWAQSAHMLGLQVGNANYALFAPLGSSWTVSADYKTITSSLQGKGYFTVAALPEASPAALSYFERYAYNRVTKTQVTWGYDANTSILSTTYTEAVDVLEPSLGTQTLMGLLPHQLGYVDAILAPYSFGSARGPLKMTPALSFTTHMPYHGVLPALPLVGAIDANRLAGYLSAEQVAQASINMGNTYDSGVSLNRWGQLGLLAAAAGDANTRDGALALVRQALERWLNAENNTPPLFAYNPNWHTIVGFPAGYGSDDQLNDHHFHWGYHIKMAALTALYNQPWGQDTGFGGAIKLLIRDAANPLHDEPYFPFLRHFDVYEGHAWASGHANFGSGNNQESSSESMNFSSGLILWGEATGNTTVRDLGIYLYTTEAEAIGQYWYNKDGNVFPAGAPHAAYAIVWGNGGAYGTWFTGAPEAISGIEFLPLNGASSYLGLWPAQISATIADTVATIGGPIGTSGQPGAWTDVNWEAQAYADPNAAIALFEGQAASYSPEQGDSRAHTYAFLYALQALGTVDATVTANISTYGVFTQGGVTTYVAYNPSCAQSRLVNFSDGTQIAVPAHTLVALQNGGVISSALLGSATCDAPALTCSVVDTGFGAVD